MKEGQENYQDIHLPEVDAKPDNEGKEPVVALEKPSQDVIISKLVRYPNLTDEEKFNLRNEILGNFFYKLENNSTEYHSESINAVELFLINISKHELIRSCIQENPVIFDVIFTLFSDYLFTNDQIDERIVEIGIQNILLRHKEIELNKEELLERLTHNPLATKDEYELGRYKELIETQVRDAVFMLKKKGYKVMSSGFGNPFLGSQMIIINSASELDVERMKAAVGEPPSGIAKVRLQVDIDNRLEIILIPVNPVMSQEGWKQAWDMVVKSFPDLKRDTSLIDNGLQGEYLRAAQDKIKAGKDAYFSQGLAFIDGEVRQISEEDFLEYEKKKNIF